ncbi:PREDICTED: monocarboxylate transporter 3-like isoform X2 [Dinoponera quadriceps]|uniref:Monocarboxylate transporter 3-like isoform X2 n=1 Tax=Dinoponera quadriceps TaxID=609295 RepID=A0A6P3YBD5_DINQU|nr:PREDICTED: monocarboxylate transporter 3-like isoform X2 [Dinoponera quadriceps]XP_014487677.1 PREDICTED: monocarboxylate transporter 3-like isoform X2 [Dinoponera quadriceps]XP_014487678.1 PREDICTED: monocarboxylate transporter 3-like isoform X2 [Dinoponera quadriceps]XP_014487679.1 PREDICTED: monocarboxylate transporter 3-like isoform X2 [Dinoponera quadriceps]
MAENSSKDAKQRAPDGGWGWFVCLGSSLISISLRSLDPSFGLLFHDMLKDLNVDSTGTSIIMSILDAIVNFSGFIIGPLLKKYSYRQVALLGSFLSCSGLILTSRANSMLHIICTYSILVGLGTGLATTSSFVALNTFFNKKRGQAVGFSMAGTAFGMMLVPQMIHLLLNEYGFRGTTLIIGGWASHSIAGSCLLRPLEDRLPEQTHGVIDKKSDEEREDEALLRKGAVGRRESNGALWTNEQNMTVESSPPRISLVKKLKESLDLDLFKDFTYLIIILGCSLFYVAETNFKLMVPFFLSNIGMKKRDVAFCLSLTAFADIIARLLLPTLFDRVGWNKRMIFWIFGTTVGITRSVLAEQTERMLLMGMFTILGFLRGATLVNLNLSISEHVTLKKLPNAFGMFMVFKGFLVVIMSPLIGYIRDVSGSYRICIHVMTAVIMMATLIWTIELTYNAFRSRRLGIVKRLQMHISP